MKKILFAVMCGLVAACSTESGSAESNESEGLVCPEDMPIVNEDGACVRCARYVDEGGRTVSAGCATGEQCFDGVCVEAQCERDLDCAGNGTSGQTDYRASSLHGQFCDVGQCVSCVPAVERAEDAPVTGESRSRVLDIGCGLGEQCLVTNGEHRCVPVETECSADSACGPRWPTCYLGTCVECVVDTDCPGHGGNDRVDVECRDYECQQTDLEACFENADCYDGNPCTFDLCNSANACEYVASLQAPDCPLADVEPAEGESEAESEAEAEGEGGADIAGGISCTITWSTPDGRAATGATMYTGSGPDGAMSSMQELCRSTSSASVSCTRVYTEGDVVCVSVTYTQDGMVRYSCQASEQRGPMTAVCGGQARGMYILGNGMSGGGCNICFRAPL